MDSSLNSLCIFYNQAVFYRRNQIEKQFILDKINKEIVETEKACKKLAESIVDLNNQPKDSIAKLNQHRRNLADLYVKQLLLNQKDTESIISSEVIKANIASKEMEETNTSQMSSFYSHSPPDEDVHHQHHQEQRQESASFSSSSSKETILEAPFKHHHDQLSYNPTEHQHIDWYVEQEHEQHGSHNNPTNEFAQVIYQQKLIETVETIVDNALHEHHSEHRTYSSSYNNEINHSSSHSKKSSSDGFYYDDHNSDKHSSHDSHHHHHHHNSGSRSPVSHFYEEEKALFDVHVNPQRRVSRDTEMDAIVEHDDEGAPPLIPKTSFTDIYSKYPEENNYYEEENLSQQSIPEIILSTPPDEPPADSEEEEGGEFIHTYVEKDAKTNDLFERTITVDYPIMTKTEAGTLTEITLDATIVLSRKSIVEETVPLEPWASVISHTYEAIVEIKPEPVYVEPESEPEMEEYVQEPEPRYSPEPEPEREVEEYAQSPEPRYSPEPEPEPEEEKSESESESESEPEPEPLPPRSPSPEVQQIPAQRYHPQRVYNIYEDIQTETTEEIIKGRRVKGNGYDYFKKIERDEVKEEGISDSSTVRASTDYGWQIQSPPIAESPDNRTPSPGRHKFPFRHRELDLGKDNQFVVESISRVRSSIDTPPIHQRSGGSSTQSDTFIYPKFNNQGTIRTPSPTTDVPDNVYNYQSSPDSNKYYQKSKKVDSPAYTPLSPFEEARILSPSQKTSTQYSESHFEIHRESQNKAVEHKPVYSKIFTIPQTHQGDQVNIPDWHRHSQEEEEHHHHHHKHHHHDHHHNHQQHEQQYHEISPQNIQRSYAPQNKTLLFDENAAVDQNNELYKAKAFKAEREKVTLSTRFEENNQRVEIVNAKRSYDEPEKHHSHLHNDNHHHHHIHHQRPEVEKVKHNDYNSSMDSESKVGRKYVVDTSQRRPPSWQKAQPQPTERLVSQYTHDSQSYHEHHESQQPPIKEHQKHVETITTVHSSTTTIKGHPNLRVQLTNNDHVHQAVTEAAENKFINARIPHSPMITPPSTPISLEPETDVPAPKIARGIFKNLERSVAEEMRREQENNSSSIIFKREQDALEAKKRLAEESLQHPGRKPKGGQILFGGSDAHSYGSQTSEESVVTTSAQKKYSFDQSNSKPKTVTFAPEHQEHLYEVNYYHETSSSSKFIKKTEIIESDNNKYSSSHDKNFERHSNNDNSEHQQHQHLQNQSISSYQAGEHFVPTSDSFDTITASAGHHQGQHSSTSSSSITNSTKHYSQEQQNNDDEKEEDFRRSKVYNSIKEASKRRQQQEEEQIEKSEKRTKVEPVKTSQNNYPQQQNYQRPSPRKEQILKERPYNFQFVNPPIIKSFNQYSIMPELEDGIVDNSASTLNSKESDILRNWDPTDLVNTLYSIDYAPRIEQKRSKFRNMEGHLEIPNDEITVPEVDPEWKKVYFRTKDSRLQWFATKYADEHPIGDILLSDADIIPNREDFTITIIPKKEVVVPKIVVKVPSNLFEKWRQAFLSHRESTQLDAYVQPILPTIPHLSENIIIIELGSCSIRAGILTHRPSLPQSFFPAIGCVTDSGEIYVGNDALKPEIRHNGTLQQPIDSVDLSVERYQLNKPVLNACLKKIITDLEIVPSKFTVLLSISQNIPSLFISELLKILLNENNFKAASIARQPSLILYSYDVTTGVVVDIGERLNIVPVIDEYIVENAIVSIPFGARQIRESLRENLKQRNNGLYAYQSPIEHTLLRYAVEQACYVSPDFDEEDSKNEGNKEVDMSGFKLAPNMESKFTVDQSRFHAPEGLFKPKKWNIEVKGLHQLIHNAIQLSPIDSRRTLYRNIYLCGGTSLLHGMAERIENELSKLVPGNIHVHVHMSPWRYHAAYLGAQVIASGKLFNKCCATKENLTDYLKQLESSSYSNGN